MTSRLFKRIYLKLIHIADIFFNEVFDFFVKLGWIHRIAYSELYSKKDIIKVEHPYPVNYQAKDKELFDEWKKYPTFENKLFEVKDVNVSEKGIVFKKNLCFVPALPHPVFKSEYGFLFSLKHYMFFKRIKCQTETKYLLVFDHWSYLNYFHWIVDSMCRLITWKDRLQDYTVLLPPNPPRFMFDTLDLLDVKNRFVIPKDSFVSIPVLHVPNYSAWSGQQHPAILKEVKQFILSHIKSGTGAKPAARVYVSRGRQKNRRVSNEQAVIDLLKTKGFQVIYFEGMSLAEQINAVKDAEVIITSHGANLTNALFSEARVLELLRNDKPNFCYWSTLSSLGITYYYQLCKVVNHDDLLVDIPQLELNLQKLLNE